jgi:hypothetical protein
VGTRALKICPESGFRVWSVLADRPEGVGHDSDAQRQENEPGKQKGNEE